ncbi:hypothetical protein HAX54_002391 [Datura stramonium]|uniref:Uncharacterized protein n=1 Tax=Datura stramonium TaxID=4076 RepID=A0ABS8WTF7_DATST|nr:hypothetical protein [Datura stramonium]
MGMRSVPGRMANANSRMKNARETSFRPRAVESLRLNDEINQRSKADIHQSQNWFFAANSSYIRWTTATAKCRSDRRLKQGSKVDLFQRGRMLVCQPGGVLVNKGREVGRQRGSFEGFTDADGSTVKPWGEFHNFLLRFNLCSTSLVWATHGNEKHHMNIFGEGNLRSSNPGSSRLSRKPRNRRRDDYRLIISGGIEYDYEEEQKTLRDDAHATQILQTFDATNAQMLETHVKKFLIAGSL